MTPPLTPEARALENIRMAAQRGLPFGHQATPQTPERMIERKEQALREVVEYCAQAGVVGLVLRDVLADAPAERAEPQGWQPIATAPIDQGAILLSDGESVTLGWWAEVPAMPGEHEAIEGWAHAGDVCFTFTATHWMPLPEPPR